MSIKQLVYIVLILLTTHNLCVAQTSNDGAFLEKALGPQPMSLGRSVTSIANGTYAIYLNPAGLSQQNNKKVQLMTFQAYEATFISSEFITPLWKKITLGVGVIQMQVSNALKTENINGLFRDIGSFNSTGSGLFISAAYSISEQFSLGLSGKYIEKTLDSHKGQGIGMDIGFLYHTKIRNKPIHVGFMTQNILPTTLTWDSGTSHKIPQTQMIGAHTTFLNKKLLTSLMLQKKEDRSLTIHSGIAYSITPEITIQVGIDNSALSMGTQLQLSKLNIGYSLNMPNKSTSNLVENISRFSIGYTF